jgi:predicted MPP superfamily phosphohydrolase
MFDLQGFVRTRLAREKKQRNYLRTNETERSPSLKVQTGACAKTGSISDAHHCTSTHSEDVQESSPTNPQHIARRTFLKWSSAAGVAAVAGFSMDGLAEAFDEPVIERFDLMHPKLDNLSRPLTIAHVTDFHLGMFFDSSDLMALVNRLNSLEFDCLFLTGDLFHSPMTRVDLAVAPLRSLKAREIGNFAVLGNHDFYAGVWRSVDCLNQSGLTVLRDQWKTYDYGKVAIHIGGIDDPMGNWVWGKGFPKFQGFIRSAPRSEGLRILLSHRPNVLPLAGKNRIDFVASGHVHGGQIIVPVGNDRGWSIARIASHYTHGWYAKDECRMYLSRGVGLTFVPWRINCPPEIALFQLKPSSDGQIRVVRSESQMPVNLA